ncbi:uncharacterized protein LOC130545925 [Triplophysa rosa]|uniref:uncharacterized protein LOC130545925 n=1 Tax=Triplophysa rosa TaxID=992332 RepID=UPI00254617D5|nr:uncharacterized protein LOC130545925 [Triplophysa rosa]
MGAQVSVVNQTPYNWRFATQDRGYTRIDPGCTTTYTEVKLIHRYIYIRYEDNTWDSFNYEFNTFKGDTSFILRETYDRSQIQLDCTSEGIVHYCPNYKKIEEDEKRRQQEEEARRLVRLEREHRIQQELERESESSRQKLSRATERLREKQSFRGHEQHHERTQALHQQIEDDAGAIERDEVIDVEEKFKELLLKYQITEDKDIQKNQIWDRIKTLQNEFTVLYCKENNLSLWSQFTFDRAIGYNELSLTEQLTVLEASLQFILHNSTEDAKDDGDQPLGWEKKYYFHLGLVEQLYATNPTLAEHILLNVLDMVSELSPQSKKCLGQMLFNRIWTPTEIMLFICNSLAIKCDQLDSVLHTALTYHLNCILVLSALRNENPLMFLQEQIKNDKEKDADTIVNELREANCPEKVLVVLKDVLRYIESELPKYELVDLTKEEINDLKNKIKSLNLVNPDINILKDVSIGMSKAVQDCSTITKDNTKIQGFFPRRTQLASLLLLLLAQLTENKGCLLEIGTGEGKSCILAMFATILAIRGIKVDIVTSSPVLAQRDQEEWKKFFEMFGITSSVVPPRYPSAHSQEERDECLKDAYRQQIVYGTVGVFAADILKQEFEKRKTRDTRQFELVIVDEVDYMTLDNGVQVTFLSHESGGFRHVEQVLSNIWAMISCCQPIEMFETGEIKWATRIQYFHKAVTAAVMGQETTDSFSANEILLPGVTLGFYTQENIDMINQAKSKKENEGEDAMSKALAEIMKNLGVLQQFDLLSIFEEVLEYSAVFKCYSLENKKATRFEAREKQGDINVEMLLLEGGLACEIMSEKSLIDATVSTIKSSIKYSNNVKTDKESNNFIVVPFFLKNYVENQLPAFVENALKTVQMSQGREYILDTSPAAERDVVASNDKHMYNAIVPVDFKASGVLEKNKKWGNGLQQFLELKHQLAISQISNVTNYMSNVHFFQRYLSGSGIFGVSGTLGGKADHDFLARHYEAKSCNVPEHRQKRMVELPVIQVKGGNHQWIQTIC